MDSDEIARRRPVWHALADLFLDTELQEHDFQHIADVITRSGYPPDEAEHILRTEVTPAFHVNLMSVAGEWAGWREDDVHGLILKRLENPAWWRRIPWLGEAFLNHRMAQVADDWREVKKRL